MIRISLEKDGETSKGYIIKLLLLIYSSLIITCYKIILNILLLNFYYIVFIILLIYYINIFKSEFSFTHVTLKHVLP